LGLLVAAWGVVKALADVLFNSNALDVPDHFTHASPNL